MFHACIGSLRPDEAPIAAHTSPSLCGQLALQKIDHNAIEGIVHVARHHMACTRDIAHFELRQMKAVG